MYIFELTKPGNWLESEDKEWSWKIERLLDHLEFAFYEANVALNLFMQQQNNQIEQQGVSQLQWEKEMQERRTIETLVREELGLSLLRILKTYNLRWTRGLNEKSGVLVKFHVATNIV